MPRSPLGLVAGFVGKCTRLGDLALGTGRSRDTRKNIAKKDGHQCHAEFLAPLKEWTKQHDDNPESTKLKDKKRLIEVQKSLTTERAQAGDFVAPNTEFVLVEDWDKEDGVFDASKVLSAFVGGDMDGARG